MLEIILAGGWLMAPILLCSTLAVAIIIERFWSLRRRSVVPEGLGDTVRTWAAHNELDLDRINQIRSKSALGRVLAAAIINRHRSREIIKEAVLDGKPVLQANAEGVKFWTVESYINTDDLVVMNYIKKDSPDRTRRIFEYAAANVGKRYDFFYSLTSGNSVYCSELIQFSFGHIEFPNFRILGVNNVSPNDVVKMAFMDKPPFKVVYFYHTVGKDNQIKKGTRRELYNKLNLGWDGKYFTDKNIGRLIFEEIPFSPALREVEAL